VYVMLGSFAPLRLKTSMPSFTPPAPYTLEPNPDSLLDKSDLVFINPVGTGYSAAIAPNVNKDFWGVDQDARVLGSVHQALPDPLRPAGTRRSSYSGNRMGRHAVACWPTSCTKMAWT